MAPTERPSLEMQTDAHFCVERLLDVQAAPKFVEIYTRSLRTAATIRRPSADETIDTQLVRGAVAVDQFAPLLVEK